MSWGAEDLADSIGAISNTGPDGRYRPTYELARSLCLLGAAAAGVPAIETIMQDFRDLDGLRERAERPERVVVLEAGLLAVLAADRDAHRTRRQVEEFTDQIGLNHLLRDAELGVARPRGQVEDQDVQAAPFHLVEQLLQGLHDHQAPPHDGGLLAYEVAHGHGLDAVVGQREKLVI